MGHFIKLFATDLFERLALGGKLLSNLDRLLCHHFMGLLGPSNEGEVRPGCNPLMPVRVQADSEENCAAFLTARGFRHRSKLRKQACLSSSPRVVSAFTE